MLLYQILEFTTHGKTQNVYTKIKNLKYEPQDGVKNWNYLLDHTLVLILNIILNINENMILSRTFNC